MFLCTVKDIVKIKFIEALVKLLIVLFEPVYIMVILCYPILIILLTYAGHHT
jgi:hypothetical protein